MLPAVAMSHGLSVTHCVHYWRMAEQFAASGFVVLDFDPSGFGASDGQPRQRWAPSGLRQDLQAAVGFLRSVPGVDPKKVMVYGSSTGGGTAIDVASRDADIAAVVCVVPHVDGLTNFPGLSMSRGLGIGKAVLRDLSARRRHQPQVTIQVIGADNSGAGVIDTDGALAAIEIETQPGGEWSADHMTYKTDDSEWKNSAAPLDLAKWLAYRPGRKLASLTCPTLLISGDTDLVTPPKAQRRMAARNDRVEVVTGPWNHFDVFRSDRAVLG